MANAEFDSGKDGLKTIDWYFDFISPFAYLASESLHRLPEDVTIKPVPVLFGALLNHYETKGPAEMAPMRRFTYRHIQWLADNNDIDLKFPPAHPFNPLKLLRLCIALGSDQEIVQRLFRFVWAEGLSSDNPDDWHGLLSEFEIVNFDDIVTPQVKETLKANTDAAIAKGVFGVPGFMVDGELFWGFDSMDFLIAYLREPSILQSDGMQQADRVPEGIRRI